MKASMVKSLPSLFAVKDTARRERRAKVLPWEIVPYGLVSLKIMLDFAAEQFYRISASLMKFSFVPQLILEPEAGQEFVSAISATEIHCRNLGLEFSANQATTIRNYLLGSQRKIPALKSLCEELQRRMSEELEANAFCYIPKHKLKFCDRGWLTDTSLPQGVIEEFQSAGRCYACGENTACVFHLMRTADWGLRRVAVSLGIVYDARNWRGIGEAITRKMELKYQQKSSDWRKAEPFYAEILTDIQALGRGHRNPVLHELEKKYDENQALYMLGVVESFALHVLKHIPE